MGAPVGNNNAARGNQLRSKIRAILSKLDDQAGKYDGYTEEELLTAYVREASTNSEIRRDFLDRMYGKPAQAIVGGDENDLPVKLQAMVELVKPG